MHSPQNVLTACSYCVIACPIHPFTSLNNCIYSLQHLMHAPYFTSSAQMTLRPYFNTLFYFLIFYSTFLIYISIFYLYFQYISISPFSLHFPSASQAVLPAVPLLMCTFGVLSALFTSSAAPTLTDAQMLITVPLSWLPVANPLVTILTVRHYRKVVMKCLKVMAKITSRSTRKEHITCRNTKTFNNNANWSTKYKILKSIFNLTL